MGKHAKLLQVILSGRADSNVRFQELVHLLAHLGFDERIRGDHHIFSRAGIEEILNLQPKGSMDGQTVSGQAGSQRYPAVQIGGGQQ